jgi:uroporphyrinogen decarboxylase
VAKALLDVLQGRSPERRPVWLMRQAGRYLPEYREIRKHAGSFLELCYNPELAAAVTLQPLQRFDFDASIVFADILVVPHAMGCELAFVENEGPVLSTVRDDEGVKGLKIEERPWQFERVYETLARVKNELRADTTLIGFCGAPWTVASYMIEGRGSDRKTAIATARNGPRWFDLLLETITELSVKYLLGQIKAGAEVVQIFDSWAGDLPADLLPRYVHGPISAIVAGVRKEFPGFPIIVFARGAGRGHAELALATGATAVSVEQEQSLLNVLNSLPRSVAVQGNLSPDVLLAGGSALTRAVEKLCVSIPKERHVFNLGHGILQQTPIDHVTQLLKTVRAVDESVSRV